MKNTLLLLLTSFMLVSCYKEDISAKSPSSVSIGSGSSSTSRYCGYPTKKGTPCRRKVSGSTGYCWQHK